MTATTPPLVDSGTLEGWFEWRAGVSVLRDSTSMGGTGWILAYDSGRHDRVPRRRDEPGVDDPGEPGPRRPLASHRPGAGP